MLLPCFLLLFSSSICFHFTLECRVKQVAVIYAGKVHVICLLSSVLLCDWSFLWRSESKAGVHFDHSPVW